eukprot:COSAG01_NODE_17744_length_1127_cov_1.277237_3_plen_58_part_00
MDFRRLASTFGARERFVKTGESVFDEVCEGLGVRSLSKQRQGVKTDKDRSEQGDETK